MSPLLLHDLSLTWPDGTVALHDITATFGTGRTGLTGANGAGKSTLLRLMAGELIPTSGTVTAPEGIGYLRQDLALDGDQTLADVLGIGPVRAALAAILAGMPPSRTSTSSATTGTSRSGRGLCCPPSDSPLRSRSTGKCAPSPVGRLCSRASRDFGLADPVSRSSTSRPTTSTGRARELLYSAVRTWLGTLVVVSHDRELLDLMDDTAELYDGGIRMFGGNFSAYLQQLAAEQETAERLVRAAEHDLRTEKRQRIEAETTLARRARYGQTDFENKRMPKIIMSQRKSNAQVSAGKYRGMHAAKVDAAATALDAAESRLRPDDHIRVQLPETAVPAGRTVLELDGIVLRGPERVALTGANGAGKTTLLERIMAAT